MAANKKTTAAKAAPKKKAAAKKQPTAAQKREAKLEARIAELEARLESALAPTITVSTGAQAPVTVSAATPIPAISEVPDTTPVVEARTIRNLRGVPVHLRLKGQGSKEPYRIVLEPRGQNGDIATVPGALVETTDFVNSYHAGLFEIITESEARTAHYGPQGFQQVQRAQLVRMEENTITTQQIETDGRNVGRPVEGHAIGMNVVNMPGSDPQVTAQFQRMNAEAQAHDAAGGVAREAVDPEAAKLQQKGIMQALPKVVTVEAGQGGQIQQW